MSRTITLRYPATCRDCGAKLAKGARARYYGRGRVYGIDCHEKGATGDNGLCQDCTGAGVLHGGRNCPRCDGTGQNLDAVRERRAGVSVTRFAGGATVYQNRAGRCIDAPCCGCCS